jgi:TonB family protein
MSESPNQWVGQIIDSKFPLQQFLGGTHHSAVFLTRIPGPERRAAALKLIQVHAASADLQLVRWRAAAQLSHPHLLRLFESGRCTINGMDFLYALTEHAPENLSQILPERALTAGETREMLQPVLAALAFLHEKNLVHGHVCPANILAIDDQVKLSADAIFPAGESRIDSRELDAHDAPELVPSSVYESADVWSLATTLVEVLTQKLPIRQDALQIDPQFPQDLPQPFLEIARRSLRLDPTRRWTVAGIAAHLHPKPAMAAAATQVATPVASTVASTVASAVTSAVASAVAVEPLRSAALSPLAVPLSSVPPLTAAKLPESQPYPASRNKKRASPSPASRPPFLIPAIAAILFFAALFVIPKFLNHRTDTSATLAPALPAANSAPPAPAKVESKTAQPQAHAASAKTPASSPAVVLQPSAQPASSKQRIGREQPLASAAVPPATAASDSATKVPEAPPSEKPASSAAARGEVLDQVLPQISGKSRSTIHGKVRIAVKVQVDAAGNVSDAAFDSQGPSKFFADLALEAARRWEFTPPEVDGRSVPSAWVLRFEISPADTKVFPKQVAP